MTRKTKQIWKEIENEDRYATGLRYRLFSPQSKISIFLGLLSENSNRCILIPKSPDETFNLQGLPKFKHLKTNIINFDRSDFPNVICISLETETLSDLFGALCDDLIERIEGQPNTYLKILFERVVLWKRLLEGPRSLSLSLEEQKGLWGEIQFLETMIINGTDPFIAINTWVGPKGSPKDFSTPLSDIEVKTTISNNHPKIKINGVEQLTNVDEKLLFLICYQIDESNIGTSLCDAVSNLQAKLINFPAALLCFNDSLFLTGYYNTDTSEYDNPKYSIRETHYFQVCGRFPRITNDSIQEGIGDLRYTIQLSSLTNFKTTLDYINGFI